MEGAWGAGANEAVHLIFEDKVSAIVGSQDGRNAHLAEQAATRSEVVFLSAWSGDPSLSQAFVPWFFSCVPNYNQQAAVFTEEICIRRKIHRITAIVDNEFDSKSALTSFIRIIKESGNTLPEQWNLKNAGSDLSELASHLRKSKTEGLILFTKPLTALKITAFIRQNHLNPAIFAPLFVLDENEIPGKDYKLFENVVFLSSEHWSGNKARPFRDEFREKYGYEPGNVAAYAFDATQVLIEAIRKGGTGREKIQKALAEISFRGVTGMFQFDGKGNRVGDISLVQIKNGNPVKIE